MTETGDLIAQHATRVECEVPRQLTENSVRTQFLGISDNYPFYLMELESGHYVIAYSAKTVDRTRFVLSNRDGEILSKTLRSRQEFLFAAFDM